MAEKRDLFVVGFKGLPPVHYNLRAEAADAFRDAKGDMVFHVSLQELEDGRWKVASRDGSDEVVVTAPRQASGSWWMHRNGVPLSTRPTGEDALATAIRLITTGLCEAVMAKATHSEGRA